MTNGAASIDVHLTKPIDAQQQHPQMRPRCCGAGKQRTVALLARVQQCTTCPRKEYTLHPHQQSDAVSTHRKGCDTADRKLCPSRIVEHRGHGFSCATAVSFIQLVVDGTLEDGAIMLQRRFCGLNLNTRQSSDCTRTYPPTEVITTGKRHRDAQKRTKKASHSSTTICFSARMKHGISELNHCSCEGVKTTVCRSGAVLVRIAGIQPPYAYVLRTQPAFLPLCKLEQDNSISTLVERSIPVWEEVIHKLRNASTFVVDARQTIPITDLARRAVLPFGGLLSPF